MVLALWNRYRYTRLFRENLPYKNHADVTDRSKPGNIHIGEPPEFNSRMAEVPHRSVLIGLVTQFASGPATLPTYKTLPRLAV